MKRWIARLALLSLTLAGACSSMGCGAGSRSPEDVSKLPRSAAKVWVSVERDASTVNAIVPRAAAEMGLDVEVVASASQPWILYRGMRLEYGAIYYRVDVVPLPGRADRSALVVYAASAGTAILENGETLSKPGELAFRIVTLAVGVSP